MKIRQENGIKKGCQIKVVEKYGHTRRIENSKEVKKIIMWRPDVGRRRKKQK